MKKLMIAFAAIAVACVANAAAVGWSLAGANAFAGDAYSFFVVGQNGTTSVAAITALLDAGTSVDAYAFGTGVIADNGAATVVASASGKNLDAGTYESFMVVFDSVTPTAGSSKYAVIAGGANQTKTFASTAANVTFVAGNQSTFLNTASNWSSYGSVPEPTSGLLMLLGMAGLALRRRRA